VERGPRRVSPKARAGHALGRSAWLAVTIVAIWNAAGEYVPLDTDGG
jgi:hypothetical protein